MRSINSFGNVPRLAGIALVASLLAACGGDDDPAAPETPDPAKVLVLQDGGTETRVVIGTVILSGVLAATLFTLFVVPVAYDLPARRTGSPGDLKRRLEAESAEHTASPTGAGAET